MYLIAELIRVKLGSTFGKNEYIFTWIQCTTASYAIKSQTNTQLCEYLSTYSCFRGTSRTFSIFQAFKIVHNDYWKFLADIMV